MIAHRQVLIKAQIIVLLWYIHEKRKYQVVFVTEMAL